MEYKPIILERGKDVRSRRRDLAILNKEGILNPESNYCLEKVVPVPTAMVNYIPAATKEAILDRILNLFVKFGAEERFYTNRIRISAPINCRISSLPCGKQILDCGGELLFEKKVVDFIMIEPIQ